MNRVALTCCLAAMDLCWVMPWSISLGLWTAQPEGRPLVGIASVLGLLLAAAFTSHTLGRQANMSRRRRFALAGLAILGAAAVVRVDLYPDGGLTDWVVPVVSAIALAIGQFSATVLAFGLALYLWWRGVNIGIQTPSFAEAESAFRWGIGRLVVFGLIVGLTTRPSVLPALEARTTPFVVTFFLVGLVTLALGRLESLRTRTRKLAVNTQWFGVLVLIAALVVLAALALAQLVSFDVLLVATRPLFDLLGFVLLIAIYAVVIPLSYALQWLIYLILNALQADPNRQPPQLAQPSDVNDWLERLFAEQLPPELLVALKTVGAAVLLGIVLLIVARALSRWRPSHADADAANEERDSLWDRQRLSRLLLDWLRRLFGRGRPAVTVASETSIPATIGDPLGNLSIRDLYARLLRIGETAGVSRGAATTPLEHEPTLRRALDPEDAVSELTRAYVGVRYAEAEATTEDTQRLAERLGDVQPKAAEA